MRYCKILTGLVVGVLSCVAPLCAAERVTTVDEFQAELTATQQAAEKEDLAGAWRHLKWAIDSPIMAQVSADGRCKLMRLAGVLADSQDDSLSAFEAFSVSSRCADAVVDDWSGLLSAAADQEHWDVAGQALQMLATRWPGSLKDKNPRYLMFVVRQISRDPASRAIYVPVLAALYDAKWTTDLGEQPDLLWQRLALARITENREREAREIISRITDPEVLARIWTDRRFAALSPQTPLGVQIRKAQQAQIARTERVARKHPRSLQAINTWAYALQRAGQFKEELALTDRTLARLAAQGEKAFDDAEDHRVWVEDRRAEALFALGRTDESVAQMTQSKPSPDRASLPINLGGLYLRLERPQAALDAIAPVNWQGDMSDFGQLQLMVVRHGAMRQLGRTSDADEALRYIEEHRAVSNDGYLWALVAAGNADAAAKWLISWLGDATESSEALWFVQRRPMAQQTAVDRREAALLETVYARPDVQAAINAVGRREDIPIYLD